MLTGDQYRALNEIRKRTDSIIDGEISIIDGEMRFETHYYLSSLHNWKKFFKKNNFIKGEASVFSTITFVGRVALAVYENNNIPK